MQTVFWTSQGLSVIRTRDSFIIALYSQQVQNTNDKEKDRKGQNKKLNC